MGLDRTSQFFLVISASLLVGLHFGSPAHAVDNPIVIENQQPGSDQWQLGRPGFRTADDTNQQIKGYASATSVNKGQSITFYVTVNPVQTYTLDIYRMGWYQGKGGRLLQHIGALSGVGPRACPVDFSTGLIECNWSPGYSLVVPNSWTSGVYLGLLTNSLGYQNYVTFVVRDDGRLASLLYQQSVTTYQAYNNYPDDGRTGKSLYTSNSYGSNTIANTRQAVKVSFDRPYGGNGNGDFLNWEVYFVRWLERSGYDVSYSTDVDTHSNGGRLLNYKGFLSVGHDEYWSKQMYDAAQFARDSGVNLAFFGANAVYWQIRFEPSSVTGAASRIMVCYKSAALDPVQGPTTTVTWRDPYLNRPEQVLVGVQYTAYLSSTNVPYIVANSSHWVYNGTAFLNGDAVPGMVGYEADRFMSGYPLPSYINNSYTLLSQSPIIDYVGAADSANSSIYQAPSGAWVFAAGTISWSWALDMTGVVDPRIQRTTANVLAKLLGIAAPSGLSATAVSSSQLNLSWTDNAANEANVVLERSTSSTFSSVTSITLAANTTGFSDTGLSASTTYYYRVKAISGASTSGYSNTASATTLASIPTAPLAPSSLTAQRAGSSKNTSINLTWADKSTNETGFVIERSTNGSEFSQLTTVATNATSYKDAVLLPSTKYYYRVKARNGVGDSAYSNVASASSR